MKTLHSYRTVTVTDNAYTVAELENQLPEEQVALTLSTGVALSGDADKNILMKHTSYRTVTVTDSSYTVAAE